MKKILIAFGGIVLLGIIAIFAPIYNGAVCSLSPQKSCWGKRVNLVAYLSYKENLELAKSIQGTFEPLPKFPENIGNYRFDVYNHRNVTECEDIKVEKVCSDVTSVRYVKDSTKEVVELDFIRAIRGRETLITNQDKYFTWDNLDGYEIGWVGYEPKRFAWFPQKDVDVIVVMEGTLEYNKDVDELPRYSDKTLGTSLVTNYFLEKYSPNIKIINQ